MFATTESVQLGLSASGLSEAVDVVVPLLLPAVALVAPGADASELDEDEDDRSPLGTTKLFGQPDAFAGFRWPVTYQQAQDAVHAGGSRLEPRYWGMNLYAQISLRDLRPFEMSIELPPDGLLLLFSAGQFGAVYYLPQWVPLVRQEFPDPALFDSRARPAPSTIELQPIVTLPHPHGPELIEHRSAPWHPRYVEWFHTETAGVRSWIGGHPYWREGDPRITAESWASPSKRDNDVTGLARSSRNWQLLLQIGDDIDINRMNWWMRPSGESPTVFSRCQTDCCFG